MKRKAWKAIGWAQGWDLAWSFSVPVAAMLAVEGLARLWARYRHGPRPASGEDTP